MSLAENRGASDAPLMEIPPEPVPTLPDDRELTRELRQPYSLTDEQISGFRQDGYIKLKHVLSPGALWTLRREIMSLFEAARTRLGSQFSSLEMMWLGSRLVREFVMCPRLARLAQELLGVGSVRLYHDNGLAKQPGCGRTPWHYDAHHFPIATSNVCTVWVPLQAVPMEMGPLGFARGMDLYKLVEDVPFNKFDTSYDRRIIERFRTNGVSVDETPFELGEVSFHHNFNFHTAGSNQTTVPRVVLATTYFEDGARVIDAPHMVNGDWRKFMPGVEPGQVIDSEYNPVLDCRSEPATRLGESS